MNKSGTRLTAAAIFLLVSLLLLVPQDAHASVSLLPLTFQDVHGYIDAGTGSLIIQLLIAGAVGGLFLIKVFWTKVKAFFLNLSSRFGKGND